MTGVLPTLLTRCLTTLVGCPRKLMKQFALQNRGALKSKIGPRRGVSGVSRVAAERGGVKRA